MDTVAFYLISGLVLPVWSLMIFAPRLGLTKKVVSGGGVLLVLAVIYLVGIAMTIHQTRLQRRV